MTLCDSGAVKLAAGANIAVLTDADYTIFINQAEGEFIADTECNWIDIYSAMNADFKKSVEAAVAGKAAIKVLRNDLEAVGTSQAVARVNILLDEYLRLVKQLKENDVITAFGGKKIVP